MFHPCLRSQNYPRNHIILGFYRDKCSFYVHFTEFQLICKGNGFILRSSFTNFPTFWGHSKQDR